MKSLSDILDAIREWSSPREAWHRGKRCAFKLSCSLASNPASLDDVTGIDIGSDLKEFWLISKSADLFKDEEYGQWGLKILSPAKAKGATATVRLESPDDIYDCDLVIGEFYGDTDLLIIDGQKAEHGEYPILVKLPLDERSEWPRVADSFADFLDKYVASQGDKYWEPS
jgi:hypothetical protein